MAHEKHAAPRIQHHGPHPHGERPGQAEPEMRGVMEETQKRAREVGEHGRSLAFGASLAQAFGAI